MDLMRAALDAEHASRAGDEDRANEIMRAAQSGEAYRLALELLASDDPAAAAGDWKYRSLPVAQCLLRAIDHHHREWRSAYCLAVARAAVAITSSLPNHVARCRALKEQANALSDCGDYEGAFASLELADIAADLCPHPAYHRAIVTFARAAVKTYTGRLSEAETLLDKAQSVFVECGDMAQAFRVETFRACLMYNAGDFDSALSRFRDALDKAQSMGDEEEQAIQHGNVAHCYQKLRQIARARLHFSIAAAGYAACGLQQPRARMLRALACLEIQAHGDSGRAAMALARDAFDRLGMAGESVLTDITEIEELIREDSSRDLAAFCRRTVSRAMLLGMQPDAIRALSAMEEAAANRKLTPEIAAEAAQHIDRSFVINTNQSPELVM